MISTVIFDLDGTVLNTLDDLKSAVDYALGVLGYAPLDIAHVRRFVGNGIRKLTDRALIFSATGGKSCEGKVPSELKASANACYAACLDYYGKHSMDKTRLYDGVAELIAELKINGIKTAVVTNKIDAAAQDLHKKLFPDIDFVIGIKDGIEPKPSCDGVSAALSALDSDEKHTLYVGDGETDVATAKNSGLIMIAVTWGFRDREELKKLGPDYIIDDPSELLDIIRNNFADAKQMANMTYAEALKRSRKAAGLTQGELAKKLGISRQSVNKWECGVMTPGVDHCIKIADIYGITLDKLVGRSE